MAELSVRYAKALFDLALESDMTEGYLKHSLFLRDTLKDEQFSRILEHPQVSMADKHSFLESAFAGNIYDDLLGFLYLAIAKNREKYLVPALNALINMIESYNRKTTAEVESATELSESQILKVKALLSKKLNKQVEIQSTTDPNLIGGLRIRVDGYFIDRTIKKQLSDMTDSITFKNKVAEKENDQ